MRALPPFLHALRAAPPKPSWGARVRPWILSLLLLPVAAYFATHRGVWTLLDYADLLVHEAGHVFFRPLGFWMGLAGGSVLQLLLPAVLAASFVRHRYRPGAQFMLVWLGQSFVNLSVYVADARAQRLPLLGGDGVLHDWHTLLSAAGLLTFDTALGTACYAAALGTLAAALLVPGWMPDVRALIGRGRFSGAVRAPTLAVDLTDPVPMLRRSLLALGLLPLLAGCTATAPRASAPAPAPASAPYPSRSSCRRRWPRRWPPPGAWPRPTAAPPASTWRPPRARAASCCAAKPTSPRPSTFSARACPRSAWPSRTACACCPMPLPSAICGGRS